MDAAQFESHALWTKPEQVSGAMSATEPVPETVAESFGQIRFLASQLSGFKSVDPRLFTLAQLDSANGQWQEVLTYLGHHQGNPTGNYYLNAQSYAEAWLQSAGAWHRPNGSTRLAQQAKSEYETLVDSYKEANDSLHTALKATMTDLDAHRNVWASEVAALRQEVAASLREATDSMDGLSREREQLRSTLTSRACGDARSRGKPVWSRAAGSIPVGLHGSLYSVFHRRIPTNKTSVRKIQVEENTFNPSC